MAQCKCDLCKALAGQVFEIQPFTISLELMHDGVADQLNRKLLIQGNPRDIAFAIANLIKESADFGHLLLDALAIAGAELSGKKAGKSIADRHAKICEVHLARGQAKTPTFTNQKGTA